MKKFLLPLALSLLACLPASAADIKLSVIADNHAPATNDFLLGRDISDLSISVDGRAKEFGVEALIRLAETILRNMTTTGTVTAATALRSARLDVTNGVDTVGQFAASGADLQILNTAGGFTDLLADEFGGVRVIVNGNTFRFWDDGSFTAPSISAAGVLYSGTDLVADGNASLGNAAADTLTVPATGNFTGRQTFQQTSGVQNDHGNQSTAVTAQLSTNAHKITFTGDATITIGGTAPAAPARTVLEFEIVQDATGGRTPTFSPAPANGQPVVDETANAVTVVYLRTSDGGTTWQAFSSYVAPGGGTGDDLGVRSEFVPVAWMQDTGANTPAAEVVTTSGNGAVRTRLFNDPVTEALSFNWQRPRDAIDATAGGDFQLKWRWVGVSPAAGLSSDTIAMTLEAVGKATGDGINSTFGTPASSSLASATHAAEDVIYGAWSELTFTSTTDGWVHFWLQLDATTSTDDVRVSGVELLYSVDLDAVTYASP